MTMAHQIRFWSKSWSGRLLRPVSFASRMRSSQRARRRCRTSRSASCPRRLLVAKAVMRLPSTSVIRSWAPGWGRSERMMMRIPAGQVDRSSSPVSSATKRTGPDLAVTVISR